MNPGTKLETIGQLAQAIAEKLPLQVKCTNRWEPTTCSTSITLDKLMTILSRNDYRVAPATTNKCRMCGVDSENYVCDACIEWAGVWQVGEFKTLPGDVLTEKEQKALMAIAKNGMGGMGGNEPKDLFQDNYSWFTVEDVMDGGFNKHEAAGLMSSLQEKSIIDPDDENTDWSMSYWGILAAQELFIAK